MSNPYTATTADLSSPSQGTASYQPKIFAMAGRIGRLRYLAYLMGMSIIMGLAAVIVVFLMSMLLGLGETGSTVVMVIVYIPIVVLSFLLVIRRLNDMNKSGWLSLLNLVPLVNIGLALWLLFGPGDEGPNNYGPPPCKNSTGVIVACFVPLIFAVLVGMMAAAFIPIIQGILSPGSSYQGENRPAIEQPAD